MKTEFECIYREYASKVRCYLGKLIGEKDAEDLTQEVFIRIDQGLPSFNHQAKLSTWIYQIATNSAIDKMRSKSAKQDLVTTYKAEIAEANLCIHTVASVEDQIIRDEMNDCIQSYVEFLPDDYRTILVLSEIDGLKNNDIAAILNLSLPTVKIRLHRAREKLKQALINNCHFYRTDCNQLACEPKGPVPKKMVNAKRS